MTPVEQFIQIVKDGGAGVVCTSMVDDDIRAFYQQPWVMVGSDGGIGGRHPRGAGTFPRVLGPLRPRSALAHAARGDSQDDVRCRPNGCSCAIAAGSPPARSPISCCFNPTTVVDRSTFSEPTALPIGIEKVFVAGELVWDTGKPVAISQKRPGRVMATPN